ncbi:hypothetical protein PhCBS80983_g01909 [Powellomyces hirtus]|uniref:Uncharacterized protein n=1 Tax=Powellomyces hirtus TaxID=109895 RepID=A0A507E8V5_9FUNG|nr:hypothetical protein DFJ77DRAFT_454815 [Powellomyces hirtus]TPX60234.1 hypothetical protein PhCBS80983_g01909 [Powellomyces hirtus]
MISIKPLLLVSAAALALTSGVYAQVDTILGPVHNTKLGVTPFNAFIPEALVDTGVTRLYVADVGQKNCKKFAAGPVGQDGSKPVFVEDIVMDRANKIAFLGSDPYRIKPDGTGGWMPGMAFLDAAYGAQGNGAMFTYAYAKDSAGTGEVGMTKLTISPPLPSFHPHGFKILSQSDGTTLLFVVNHRAQVPYDSKGLYSVVEILKYDPKVSATTLKHIRTVQHELIYNPNNVIPVSSSSFYVSNDHTYREGAIRSIEEYAQLPTAWITYCDVSSGTPQCIKAADGLRGANGINTDGERIWLNEAVGGDVIAFSRNADNTLTIDKRYNLDYVPDNISYEPTTKTFTSTGHPQALKFQAYASGTDKTAPSWVDIIRPADGTVKRIFSDSGDLLSGSTVFEVDVQSNVALLAGVFDEPVVRCQVPNGFSS